MKIEYHEGCTSHGLLEIDGEDFYTIPENEQKSIAHYLVDKISTFDHIYNFISNICESEGKQINKGHCDQCGDYYCTYELEA